MCGIAGILSHQGTVDRNEIEDMCEMIRHRGPDEFGLYVENGFGFGIRRLSIIDLATGSQPIWNEDRSVATVYNGEIYNFKELRQELEGLGHCFATASDTEVIVHGYEQWGVGCLKRFIGMFAFALWDRRDQSLLVARDPLGIKPLYYTNQRKRFQFASELKCLVTNADISGGVDPISMREYFSYGIIHAPRTPYTGIHKLLPGEYLVLRRGGRRIEKGRYWQIKSEDFTHATAGDLTDALQSELRKSVHRQMNADVPFGAFLSGGVDSSALVSMMTELAPSRLQTFSIGFRKSELDESRHAKRVADYLGTDHHTFFVEPGHAQDILPTLAKQFDEPFADASAIPLFYLSQLTRQHVKVSLSGDGADEILGGYTQFQSELLFQRTRMLPRWPIRWAARLIEYLAGKPVASASRRVALGRISRILDDMCVNRVTSRYLLKSMICRADDLQTVLSPDLLCDVDDPVEEYAESIAGVGSRGLDAFYALSLGVRLPNDMLVKVDRASMANSLEVRVPFLDHPFVEFCARIPTELKLKGFDTKILLRKVLRRYLPPHLTRRPKQGFVLPIESWFKEGWGVAILERLDDGHQDKGILNCKGIERLVTDHARGRVDKSEILYALLFYLTWCDVNRR